MLDTRRQDEDVPGAQDILAIHGIKDDLALEDLQSDRSSRAMSRYFSPCRQGDDRQPKHPLFDQGARATPVSCEQGLVNQPLVRGQVVNEHIALESTVHR